MLLRINNLVKGFSGIRLETVQTMVDMLNKGVTAFIPEKGSLGASGDLAPLSHMVLPMLGLGMAYYKGELLPGAEAMKRAGIPTIELYAKEGLALNNGTQAMTSAGALAVYDALNLLKVADIADALCFEAPERRSGCSGSKSPSGASSFRTDGNGQKPVETAGRK